MPPSIAHKPELLAPAGSIESFHAAIDAGADAVYAGLDDYNARLRAKNFTVKTLSFLVPYAHAKKRKLYVAFNTLVKQAELEQCVHLLHQLYQIGVDAVIVQDFGIAGICRTALPRLRLHASTQMSIHNSLGTMAARDMGISRAVLARELTIDEIAAIRKKSAIELEVFVHGALCYCFSGMCLASSFLGGSSGNRGRCTQVCRRPFQARHGAGHFFSPADLCGRKYCGAFRDIGIDSLKIEGRMKNEDYVFAVVSAYRRAIDGPRPLPEHSGEADFDLGRRKSALFLPGVRQEGIIDPTGPSGTGAAIGAIEKRVGSTITVSTDQALSEGDFVRIQPKSGFEGSTCRISQSTNSNGRCMLVLKENCECDVGDMVYLTRRAMPAYSRHEGRPEGRHTAVQKPVPYNRIYPKVEALLKSYKQKRNSLPNKIKRRLSIIIDDPGWRNLIDPARVDGLVAAFAPRDIEKRIIEETIPEVWQKKIIVGLPKFIPETGIGFWKTAARALAQKGIRRVMCANIGQWRLFDPSVAVFGGAWLWCFNRAAQKALSDRGVRVFSYSPEDDFPNMRSAASHQGMAYLYSHIPLFISRIRPMIGMGETCRDSFGNEFFTAEKDGLYYLVANKPLCLFHKRKKLEEAGINSFIIDLSFCKPDKQLLKEVLQKYEHGIKVEGSSMFNFKLGIR